MLKEPQNYELGEQATHRPAGGHLASEGALCGQQRSLRVGRRRRPLHGLRDTAKAVILVATRLITSETRRVRTESWPRKSPRERKPRTSAPPGQKRGFAGECWGRVVQLGREKAKKMTQKNPPALSRWLWKGCRRAVSLIPLKETPFTGPCTGRSTRTPHLLMESKGRTGLGHRVSLRVPHRADRAPRISGRKEEILFLGSKSHFPYPPL